MKFLLLTFTILSFSCVAQDSTKVDSLKLTTIQETKLLSLENQINDLKQKQLELIQFILDAKGYDIQKVIDFKYEKGKFIFKTRINL